MLLVQGGIWLAGALQSDRSRLGLSNSIAMNSKNVAITDLLGRGESAIVYAGTIDGMYDHKIIHA